MKPTRGMTQKELDIYWANQDIEPKDILEEFDDDFWLEEDLEDDILEVEKYYDDDMTWSF